MSEDLTKATPAWVKPASRPRYYHKIHNAEDVTEVMNSLTAAGYDMEEPEYIENGEEESSIPGKGDQQLFLIVGERYECACANCALVIDPPAKPGRRRKGKAD